MKIPDRWFEYTNFGYIHGTRFIAFKVPLREGYNRCLPATKSFTPADLLRNHPNLKLVIDLTFTTKYYNGVEEFKKNGVQYIKFKCPGQKVPSESIFRKFVKIVDQFVAEAPPSYLIGVHCTHGVNRTGYLIVRYMIERLGYSCHHALRRFLESRGHAIERTNYIEDLRRREKSKN